MVVKSVLVRRPVVGLFPSGLAVPAARGFKLGLPRLRFSETPFYASIAPANLEVRGVALMTKKITYGRDVDPSFTSPYRFPLIYKLGNCLIISSRQSTLVPEDERRSRLKGVVLDKSSASTNALIILEHFLANWMEAIELARLPSNTPSAKPLKDTWFICTKQESRVASRSPLCVVIDLRSRRSCRNHPSRYL